MPERTIAAAARSRDPRLRAIIHGVIRKAFRMEVPRGPKAEYVRRHTPIWRELEQVLIEHGVRSYSIYLDPHTNDLFGYLECDSEARWNAIAETDVCRRWWRFMREIMTVNGDDSPVSRELCEVFHLQAP
jgi:L-rhamnose mutarotase